MQGMEISQLTSMLTGVLLSDNEIDFTAILKQSLLAMKSFIATSDEDYYLLLHVMHDAIGEILDGELSIHTEGIATESDSTENNSSGTK